MSRTQDQIAHEILYGGKGHASPKVSGPGPMNSKDGLDLTTPNSGSVTGASGVGHHRTSPKQSIAIGIATSPRRANGGTGVRPTSGRGLEGARPEITRAMHIANAEASARQGLEFRLVEAAKALEAVESGPVRKRILSECRSKIAILENGEESGRTVAEAVRQALGL